MLPQCAGWVHTCMPARHRDPTPPQLRMYILQLGGGAQPIQPSPPSTMWRSSRKWSEETHPFSVHPQLFSNVKLKVSSLH